MLCVYLLHKMPDERTMPWLDKTLGTPQDIDRFERAGVRRWKDVLPDGGSIGSLGFPKRSLASRDMEYLERFATETLRAEAIHWTGMLGALALPPIWGWGAGGLLAIAWCAVDAPFIAVQRYNRARLARIAKRMVA
jgi:glycosyl-4,4'-diaponeurosporenoate acyltransferase